MELVFEQVVSAPRDRVFGFHRDPANLSRLLGAWPRFRLLHCEDRVRVGGLMWIQETFWRIPVALGFVHHRCAPPRCIGSRLFHGPFERFTHLYTFDDCGPRTRVRMKLDVRVPRRFGGEWMLRRWIAPEMHKAFRCRQRALERLATGGDLADLVYREGR